MKNEKIFTEFYISYKNLCKKNGYTIYGAAKAAGVSSGAPAAWEKGSIPRKAQREKLCALFKVSDDELLGYKNSHQPKAADGDLDAEFMRLIRLCSPEQKAREIAYLREILGEKDT